jgi:hypothetical protein
MNLPLTLLVLLVLGCSAIEINNLNVILQDDIHISIKFDFISQKEDTLIDFAPVNTEEYRPSSCLLDFKSVYEQLEEGDFESCQNGTTYEDIKNPIWKVSWCEKESTYLNGSVEAILNVYDILNCILDSYSQPRFLYKNNFVQFQIVSVYQIHQDANFTADLQMELHFDTPPAYSNVLGTNYILTGPVFHSNMPYGSISNIQADTPNEFDGFNTDLIGLSQISYLSFISDDGTRVYSGSAYFLVPTLNIVDVNHPLAEIQIEMKVGQFYQDEILQLDVLDMKLSDNISELIMKDKQLINTCQSYPKVIFSNGVYRLSSTNYDHCSLYNIKVSVKTINSYSIDNSWPFAIAFHTIPQIDYVVYGTDWVLLLNSASVNFDSLSVNLNVTILKNGTLSIGSYISDIQKLYNSDSLPLQMTYWKSENHNQYFLIELGFAVYNSKAMIKDQALSIILGLLNDVYSLVVSDSKGETQTTFQVKLNTPNGIYNGLKINIPGSVSSNKIVIGFSASLIPLVITIALALYFYSIKRRHVDAFHMQ